MVPLRTLTLAIDMALRPQISNGSGSATARARVTPSCCALRRLSILFTLVGGLLGGVEGVVDDVGDHAGRLWLL